MEKATKTYDNIDMNKCPCAIIVWFSWSVMSDSIWSHGLQHTRLPCPSPTPRTCSNSCPSGWWCHPTISSSVVPFSSCPQSLPASGSFPMSQFFASGGQSIGASDSASVLPMNIQDWFPLGWTGWISLQFKGHSRVFSNTTVRKHQFFDTQLSLQSNSHIHDFLGGSDGKASVYNAGEPGSSPGLGRFPWRRKWQPNPVLLPGEPHGQRNLTGYRSWGCKELDRTEVT